MKLYVSRACPGCSSTAENSKREIGSSNSAEEMEFEKIQENWIGFRKDQVFFTYWRCASCDLLYNHTYLSRTQLQILYSAMPDNTAGEKIDVLNRTQQGYANLVARLAPASGRWLDLGADIGMFSAALQQRLSAPNITVDAVEPNLKVWTQLRRNLGPHGSVFTSISDCSSDAYVGIAAVHVLDHLVELDREIGEVRRCLKPGGIFALVVHNEKSVLRRVMGRRWPPFCLQHPQLFSPSSIRNVLSRHGFSEINVYRSTNVFTLRHLFEVVLRVFRAPISLSRVIPNIAVPLKLGNLIVTASKSV